MNQNIAMILFIVLALGIGLVFGWELKIIWTKGNGSKDLLGTADTVIDGVKSANDTFGKLIPAPLEFIIDKVLQTAQAGVHAAQQLCDSSQLTEDQRKQKAFDSAMNLLKLEGYQSTPELEKAVKDAIETGVFVMKNIVKTSVAVPVVDVTQAAAVSPVPGPVQPTVAGETITTTPTDAPAPSVVTIQQAVAQGIKDKLTPVAQQQGEQTVQEIINTTVNDAVNKVNPSVTA